MATKFLKQKAEIEGICKRLGVSWQELGDFAAIKSETMRKITKGYQAASERMMRSIRQVEEAAGRSRPARKGGNYGANASEMSPEKNPSRGIRVVSWARAGQAADYSDMADQIDEMVKTDCRDETAFALIIEGDSMAPAYMAGDIVVFSPGSEPRNGDIVAARLADSHGVLFKRFRRTGFEGKKIVLESINPDYKTQEFDISAFRFIYPAVELKRFIRR